GADDKEIIFTSGSTESSNLALKGVVEAQREGSDRALHVITTVVEHKSVLDSCKHLEKTGVRMTRLGVSSDGAMELDALRAAITDDTILISVMYANNEIGTIQNIAEIGRIAKERGVLFHTDAAQAAGKVPIDVVRDNIDLMSITAHKMYGPKGVGA